MINAEDRRLAIIWANALLNTPNAVIIDTETTGVSEDSDVVQLSAISISGETIWNEYIRPTRLIEPQALVVNKISQEVLDSARPFKEVWTDFLLALPENPTMIAYNAIFDKTLLSRNAERAGCPFPSFTWTDALEAYSFYTQGPQDKPWRGTKYRMLKLPGANHDSLGDCRAVLTLIKAIANGQTV